MKISFRQFMELREVPGDTLAVLDKEFNIGAGSIIQIPVAGKAVNGKDYHDMAIYRVVKVEKDNEGRVTGATIKMEKATPQQNAYFQDDEKRMIQNPDNDPEDGKEMFITRGQLMQMFNPEAGMQQPGAGGAPPMGGMPPGM